MRVRSSVRAAIIVALLGPTAAQPMRAAQQVVAPAMVPIPPQTRIETLLTSPNAVVIQDLYRVSDQFSLSFGLTVDAVVVTEIARESKRERGLRVELRDSAKPEHAGTSYLDLEEVASLSKALAEISALAAQYTGREDARVTEVHFATVGGFVVGFRQDLRHQQGFLSAGGVEPVRRSVAVTDYPTIKASVDQALAVLQGK